MPVGREGEEAVWARQNSMPIPLLNNVYFCVIDILHA